MSQGVMTHVLVAWVRHLGYRFLISGSLVCLLRVSYHKLREPSCRAKIVMMHDTRDRVVLKALPLKF